MGLADTQDPAHHKELMAALLTAHGVADLLGVADPSIVYRWEKVSNLPIVRHSRRRLTSRTVAKMRASSAGAEPKCWLGTPIIRSRIMPNPRRFSALSHRRREVARDAFLPPGYRRFHPSDKAYAQANGIELPLGFTGGNLDGVCVPSAVWRPTPHLDDPRDDEEGPNTCSL